MSRARFACCVNLLVPGSGLILLRREWLGVSLALLFVLVGQLAVVGTWIVPDDLPAGLAWVAWGATVIVWGLSQGLVWQRIRFVTAPAMLQEQAELRDQAEQALATGDLAEALRVLLAAMSLNDEDAATIAVQARLQTAMGRAGAARRSWKRVLTLHPPAPIRDAALQALGKS